MRLAGSPYAPAQPRRGGARRHRLHPPGAQSLHQPDDRREHLPRRLPAPRLRTAALIDRGGHRRTRRASSCSRSISTLRRTRRSIGCRRASASWSRSARALQLDAEIIIFDEPTTSLTARETERLFALIERLRAGRQVDDLHLPHPRRRHGARRRHRRAARRRAGRRRPESRLHHRAHDHADGRPADRAALSAAPHRAAAATSLLCDRATSAARASSRT